MLDRQVNDEKALLTLEPFIDALKASISMQKAVENHLMDLEKLRAYGYSNGFISAAVSSGSGRIISAGLFASMMYRARMKVSAEKIRLPQMPTTQKLLTPEKAVSPVSQNPPNAFATQQSSGNGDRRRNEPLHNPVPDKARIYSADE